MGTYLDWIEILQYIPEKENKVVLELGCGKGTEHLCRHFKKVYSFEVYDTKKWYDLTAEQAYKNWEGYFATLASFGLHKRYDRDRKQLRAFTRYLEKLKAFVNLSEIDVAFVDQGFYMRGESVVFFMSEQVPYIIAHDTAKRLAGAGYGYQFIKSSYKTIIRTQKGCGTTAWIK